MEKIIRFGKNTKLADVILTDHNFITIITRFGIKFGFGDASIEQVCKTNNINLHLFLKILRTFQEPEYDENDNFDQFSHKDIIDYLLKSHNYYRNVKIPYIEELLLQLSWNGDDNLKNKSVLKNFFEEYKKEVFVHTGHEEKEIFPYVFELDEALKSEHVSDGLLEKIKKYPIENYKANHSDIDEALLDLKNLIIKFLPSPLDQIKANRLLIEIFKLERDLKDHARIEENLLVPKVKILESNLLNLIEQNKIK